jgi:hypothetical protein
VLRIPLVLALCSSLMLPLAQSYADSRDDHDDDGVRHRYAKGRHHGDDEDEGAPKDALHRCSWGLDFQVRGEDVVTSFHGATIAFRKQVSPHDAWRLALTAGVVDANRDDFAVESDSLTGVRNERVFEGNDQFYAATILQIRYPDPDAEVKFYYGFGPTGHFSRGLVTADVTSSPTVPPLRATITSYRRAWAGGLAAVAGAQWFATRSIGLFAEYGAEAVYSETLANESARFAESGRVMETRSKSHGFSAGSTGATLGIAFYF